MFREATLEELDHARRQGAAVIDVRQPEEYVDGHIPGAQLLPLTVVPGRVRELPRHEPVYVVCASGNRSAQAAAYLARAGIDARSVAGGTSAWIGNGRPVRTGTRAA